MIAGCCSKEENSRHVCECTRRQSDYSVRHGFLWAVLRPKSAGRFLTGYAVALAALGQYKTVVGLLEEAESYFLDALKVVSSGNEMNGLWQGRVKYALGVCLSQAGRLDQAIENLAQAVSILGKVLGPTAREVAFALHRRGVCLIERDALSKEARDHFRRADEILAVYLDGDDFDHKAKDVAQQLQVLLSPVDE